MTYVPRNRGRGALLLRRIRGRGRAILKQAWQPLSNPGRRSRAAFLLGSGRSGTDLVAAKLGESLSCRLVNEDNPAAFENWRLRELDFVRDLVARSFAPVVLFKPIVETWRAPELLDGFEGSRAVFIGRGWADTTNSLVSFFGDGPRHAVGNWVESRFESRPSWAVPHVTRDAVCELHQNARSAADFAAIYWFLYNSAWAGLDLDTDARAVLVLYEDLVSEPERELRRCCSHLGVPFSNGMVRDIFSSVSRRPAPDVATPIAEACETLWAAMRAPPPGLPAARLPA